MGTQLMLPSYLVTSYKIKYQFTTLVHLTCFFFRVHEPLNYCIHGRSKTADDNCPGSLAVHIDPAANDVYHLI